MFIITYSYNHHVHLQSRNVVPTSPSVTLQWEGFLIVVNDLQVDQAEKGEKELESNKDIDGISPRKQLDYTLNNYGRLYISRSK